MHDFTLTVLQDMHKLIWGVDLTLEFLMSLCDIAIDPPRYAKPQKSMLHLLVHAPLTGVLQRTDFLDEIKRHPVRIVCNMIYMLYVSSLCISASLLVCTFTCLSCAYRVV